MDSLHKQVREKQQRAAVDLKHHIDAAQAGLGDKAEVHQTRAKQQAEMHAKEFNALLESGKNPYAVGSYRLSQGVARAYLLLLIALHCPSAVPQQTFVNECTLCKQHPAYSLHQQHLPKHQCTAPTKICKSANEVGNVGLPCGCSRVF